MGGSTFGKAFVCLQQSQRRTQQKRNCKKKQRYGAGKSEKELQIGNKVLIRNRGLKGRGSIQDRWKPEVHLIVGKPYKFVFSVKLVNSDSVRNVNRKY